MSHIYITNNGAVMSVEGGRFVITGRESLLKSIPKEECESVTLFGNSHITTRCTQELLTRKIPVCYFSSSGAYYGRLESMERCDITLLEKQFALLNNEEVRLKLARKIVLSKVRNQSVVLRRYAGGDAAEHELHKEVRLIKDKIRNAESIEQLLGYEGHAAKLYFKSVSAIVPREFAFNGRNRRPPRDAFNSMLNLGYTLLQRELFSKLQIEGLNPYLGILHHSRNDYPALASDVIEEWRATLVDSLVLGMINRREISIDDFHTDSDTGGVYLTNEGLKKFIRSYERKMNAENKYLEGEDNSCTFREALNIQCRNLKRCILADDVELYKPVIIR